MTNNIRILASDGIETAAAEELVKRGFEVVQQFYPEDELKTQVQQFDALVVRSATKVRQGVLDAAAEGGRLKLIIRAGVGIDNIDAPYAQEKGIKVTNTPRASSSSVAELALAHILCLARHVHSANVSMRRGEWNKKDYEGVEIAGKTLGLIGMGRIARELAQKANALGMHIIYTDIIGRAEDLPDYEFVSYDDVLRSSDFISIHIPKPGDREYVIGAEDIAKMKDGVFLVNTARGWLINGDDVMDAIDSGKVAGAAFDVFREEPTHNQRALGSDKVSVTPHIGASTKEAQTRIGEEVVAIITDFFSAER